MRYLPDSGATSIAKRDEKYSQLFWFRMVNYITLPIYFVVITSGFCKHKDGSQKLAYNKSRSTTTHDFFRVTNKGLG